MLVREKQKIFVMVFVLLGYVDLGNCIRCYECSARLGPGHSDPCLYGDEIQLRRVQCVGPSVCAAYYFETFLPGAPPITSITRGCQALRFGGTCEDIFHDLRRSGQILPGHHTCATCSTDLCNSSMNFTCTSIVFSFFIVLISRLL